MTAKTAPAEPQGKFRSPSRHSPRRAGRPAGHLSATCHQPESKARGRHADSNRFGCRNPDLGRRTPRQSCLRLAKHGIEDAYCNPDLLSDVLAELSFGHRAVSRVCNSDSIGIEAG